MTLQKPTIVLFDMDGTTVRHLNPKLLHILEKLDDGFHAFNKFLTRLLRRKIETTPLVEHREGKRPKLLVHRAIHHLRRKEVDQIVAPCPGIYRVLDFLTDSNIRMGLISNGLGKGYGHDILQRFDLEKYFEVKIFREDIPRAKPYPDPILKAVENLDRPLTENDVIWFIGDRQKDIEAAIAAQEHLPCPLLPFAYNLQAVVAVLRAELGTDHIFMSWGDCEQKLRLLTA